MQVLDGIAKTSPLQLYNSALLFSSDDSIIRGLFSHELPSWAEKVRPAELDNELCKPILPTAAMTFSHNGRLLASSYSDNTVGLWDPFTGTLLRTLKGHSKLIIKMVFSHDGQLLASASFDNTIRLWDPFTGTLLRMLKGRSGGAAPVVFSHDSQLLASVSHENTIGLWDPFTGTLLRMLKGHSEWILLVVFSHDGQLLASASYDNTIGLWDPFTGTLLRMLEGHSDLVVAVAFSHDGQLLASASDDNTVRLWETKTQTEIQLIEHEYHGHISFKDGSRLELDGRLVDVPSFSSRISSHEQGLTDVSYSLSLKILDNWVLYHGIKVLSIPRNYHRSRRNKCVLHGNSLAVLDSHGLNFLRFSETATPFES